MRFYWLIIYTLGVWRLTHLLSVENGPWDLMLRLRASLGRGFWASLLDCFYCLSLWIAVPFALLAGDTWRNELFLWLALSAGAILLERVTSNTKAVTPTPKNLANRMVNTALAQCSWVSSHRPISLMVGWPSGTGLGMGWPWVAIT